MKHLYRAQNHKFNILRVWQQLTILSVSFPAGGFTNQTFLSCNRDTTGNLRPTYVSLLLLVETHEMCKRWPAPKSVKARNLTLVKKIQIGASQVLPDLKSRGRKVVTLSQKIDDWQFPWWGDQIWISTVWISKSSWPLNWTIHDSDLTEGKKSKSWRLYGRSVLGCL